MAGRDAERLRMVREQVESRGVRDAAVLRAMTEVPREAFVPEDQAEFAYRDTPLPIAEDQTISQPYIVALMAAALELEPDDRVLEIGTGSGYAAGVLSRIAAEVYTVERHAALAEGARRALEALGYENVHVLHGDGTLGWADHAPYDGIVVAAGGPDVPEPLVDQLAVGGRLVIPVGPMPRLQELVRVTRVSPTEIARESLEHPERKDKIRVVAKAVPKYLGVPKYRPDSARGKNEIGLTNGLAYTTYGGAILECEVSVVPGKGKLVITGLLEKGMQESAQAAVSYIRSRESMLGLPKDFYQSNDFHIHFPEFVPKDGPSAGVTIATSRGSVQRIIAPPWNRKMARRLCSA